MIKRTTSALTLLAIALAAPVAAQIPDMKARIEQLARDNPNAFACAHTPAPCGYDFVKIVACKLNPEPSAGPWGMNGRRGNLDAPSWDALNYRGAGHGTDSNTGGRVQVVDFIVGAGAPGARVDWNAFTDPVAASGGWIKPQCKGDRPVDWGGAPAPAPQPLKPAYPGDQFGWAIGQALAEDYAQAGQAPNPGMGVWFWRTAWDTAVNGLEPATALRKHRAEWRKALGLTPSP